METLDNLGLGHFNSLMGGSKGTSYPMSSTNCGPNFIGPQGTTYTIVGHSCGLSFVRPFQQPYQMSPSPLISEGAHLLAVAPSHVRVPEQRMPIMFCFLAFIVIGNHSTQLLESKVRTHK
jgi:hypothetical protein